MPNIKRNLKKPKLYKSYCITNDLRALAVGEILAVSRDIAQHSHLRVAASALQSRTGYKFSVQALPPYDTTFITRIS